MKSHKRLWISFALVLGLSCAVLGFGWQSSDPTAVIAFFFTRLKLLRTEVAIHFENNIQFARTIELEASVSRR